VGTLTWPVKLVLVALSVILAWLTWLLIEQRLRRRINRFSLPKVFAAAALAMAVVVVSGWGLTKAADIHQAKSDDSLAAAQKDPDACVGAAALEPGAAKKKACNQDGRSTSDPHVPTVTGRPRWHWSATPMPGIGCRPCNNWRRSGTGPSPRT
jgi:hypothetical protein